jgi:hypothetical protein
MMKDELQAGSDDDSSATDQNSFSTPLPTVIVQSLPSPLSPLPSFVGSAMFSYLVAAVIVSVGLTVAAAWKLSEPANFVDGRIPVVEKHRQTPRQNGDVVGRITGTLNCQWHGRSAESVNGAPVSLGQKYAISSGLMELTYDTGARVVLQGPVTYEVESSSGGYLSVGKLTARLEEKSEVRGQRSDSANQKSEIINHQFVVRTPTAVVTDLGTEFGVEVDRQGATTSHVFQGSVRLETIASDGTSATVRVLHANESVQVRKDSNNKSTVQSIAVAADRFTRPDQFVKVAEESRQKAFRRWEAYSRQLRRDPSLVAYYDFQQQSDRPSVLANKTAGGDAALDGAIVSASQCNGRTPGKHALRFKSRSDHVELNLPQAVDDLTLAAWVCVESLKTPSESEYGYSALLASNDWGKSPGQTHWHIRSDGRLGLVVCNGLQWYSSKPLVDRNKFGRWNQWVVVYDHKAAKIACYADGNLVDEGVANPHAPIRFGPAWIGHWNGWEAGRNLYGRIDELAVFSRPLSADEVRRIYEAGKPDDVEGAGAPSDKK